MRNSEEKSVSWDTTFFRLAFKLLNQTKSLPNYCHFLVLKKAWNATSKKILLQIESAMLHEKKQGKT